MARLYESSTLYEQEIDYAGGVVNDRTYNDSGVTYSLNTVSYDGYTAFSTIQQTATGSGTGSSTATGLHKHLRTATGSGTGTSLNAIVHKQLRTATGSGGATTGDTATGLHTQIRTATGSGTGTETATGLHKHPRTGTGSGTGADIAGTWIKSFIFRPPAEADFAWAPYHGNSPANRLFSRLTPGASRLNVYKLTDGTYTSVDPRNDNLVVKTYFGGHNNFVTAEEKADLVAAGYEVT